MKVKYFADTDTAYLEFSQNNISETKDINDDILLDLDSLGNLVGMTIEHAKTKANLDEVSYQQMAKKVA
jgi:uncharacterized protein YuzE